MYQKILISCELFFTNLTYIYLARVTALGSQLVDLGLCNVSTLLSLLQLVLDLPALGQMNVGLLLLQCKNGNILKWLSGIFSLL